jgi:hypothetical protein
MLLGKHQVLVALMCPLAPHQYQLAMSVCALAQLSARVVICCLVQVLVALLAACPWLLALPQMMVKLVVRLFCVLALHQLVTVAVC